MKRPLVKLCIVSANPAVTQKNISYKFFQTGHMVYINDEALKTLHDTTAAFVKAVAAALAG